MHVGDLLFFANSIFQPSLLASGRMSAKEYREFYRGYRDLSLGDMNARLKEQDFDNNYDFKF